jgi:hypothetical protein
MKKKYMVILKDASARLEESLRILPVLNSLGILHLRGRRFRMTGKC